jgi:hypothetical protein
MLLGRLAAVDARLLGGDAYASWEDITSCQRLTGRCYDSLRDEIRASILVPAVRARARTAGRPPVLTVTSPAFLCCGSVPLAASIHSVCHSAATPCPRVLALLWPPPSSSPRGALLPQCSGSRPCATAHALDPHSPGEQLQRKS